LEAWSKASDIAEAYAIGPSESGAAINLQTNCDKPVVNGLADLVKTLVSQVHVLFLEVLV